MLNFQNGGPNMSFITIFQNTKMADPIGKSLIADRFGTS